MNYLGHLYFSGDNLALQVANLNGDFVKGKNLSYLPLIVQKGALLHRSVDDYIDHHPLVTELRLELYKVLPKVAGIAIDLYFDHLLSQHWEQYHTKPLEDFIDDFFNYALQPNHLKFTSKNYVYSEEYQHLLNIMQKQRWLRRYKYEEGLEMAAKGLSKRISFKNSLYKAPEVFTERRKRIETVFFNYMSDARMHFHIY